ncbi:PfkB family carbohydrate kinase [Jannaschia marina]|uniref:PfkB family carbohydrate kinase n=1 Tax=Jannaschia marina TaxID=2741674 RepID=UPI0015C93A3E|nr:PfkB family carbohydrate kinase [Jannaschia marina]
MTRVLGLGDNTVDIYVDHGLQYPGGNSVNFAVYAKRLGVDAAYLGCVGDDALGRIVIDALEDEGVDTSRTRLTQTPTSWSRVRHSDGDRWFDGSHLYTDEDYALTDDDLDFMSEFDLVHTGVNSRLDKRLRDITSRTKLLSYDFSDKYSEQTIAMAAPFVDVVALSTADQPKERAIGWARLVASYGPKTVLITRGSEGAICLHENAWYRQSIVEVDATDTLGAGDAFLTAFLVRRLKGADVPQAMHDAATFAARVCTEEAAFGHGSPVCPGQPGLERPSA